MKLEGKDVPASLTFDRVLVSVGRRPNSAGLGLDKAGVNVSERGFIPIDKQRRTNVPHIFAIGDVGEEPGLAHKATAEARVAVEVILGEPAEWHPRAIPAVIFTDPEIAWAGITQQEAVEGEHPARRAEVPVGGERPGGEHRPHRGAARRCWSIPRASGCWASGSWAPVPAR